MEEYLNNLLKEQKIDLNLKQNIEIICNNYLTRYAYFGISTPSWEKMFIKAIDLCLDKPYFNKRLEHVLNKFVNTYIIKCLNNQNIIFIDNYLISLKKSERNLRQILKMFYHFIENYLGVLDNAYFNFLIKNSKYFYPILDKLTISHFTNDQVKLLNLGEYDWLFALKPYNMSFIEANNNYKYIKSLLIEEADFEKKELASIINTKEFQKIKYILNNYNYIMNIKQLLLQTYPQENLYNKKIDFAIFNLNQEELVFLIDHYAEYIAKKETKNPDFLLKIYMQAKRVDFIPEKFKETRTLYSFFKANTPKARWFLDVITSNFKGNRKENIEDYLNEINIGYHIKQKSKKDLEMLTTYYQEWLKTNQIPSNFYLENIFYNTIMEDWFITIWHTLGKEQKRINIDKLKRIEDAYLNAGYSKEDYASLRKEQLSELYYQKHLQNLDKLIDAYRQIAPKGISKTLQRKPTK